MKKKLLSGLATCLLTLSGAGIANSASFTFDGDIAYHNDVIEIAFTLDTDATDVSVWTDSYMSGTNFDPITAVWQSTGSGYSLVAQNDDNGSIAAGQTNWDSGLLFNSLSAGNYLFTIATFNNWALGTLLSDGFTFDADTPISLAVWHQPASDVNMGTYYRVNLSGVDSASNNSDPVPEPTTMLLFGTGLAGLVGSRRRSMK
jgi:hypothetical protein